MRSQLEYCSVVWSPFYTKYIQAIENIQKRFIRLSDIILHRIHVSNYPSNLTNLNMMSIFNRRKYSNLIYLYKILNGHVFDSTTLLHISLQVPSHTRNRNNRTFYVPCCRTNYQYSSPLRTMFLNYNEHQHQLDIFGDSLTKFKRRTKDLFLGNE